MGGSIVSQTRKQLKSSNFNWNLHSRTAYCIKVEDKTTGLVGQKYTIGQELLQKEWRVYLLRNSFPDHLVSIYDILPQQTNSICTTNKLFSVVIEYIPYRLSDLGAIRQQQAIYILNCILRGYKILKDNSIDFYLLDQNNICFNKNGKCKIWINENLYYAKPDTSRIISQKHFVQSVYYMMQERVNSNKLFFSKNLAIIKNLTLEHLLEQTEKSTSSRLMCMESLKNMSSQISKQNHKTIQIKKNIIQKAFTEKKVDWMSPSYSSKRKQSQESSFYYCMTSTKKLSLAAKKKELSLAQNKTIKHPKSSMLPIQTQLRRGQNNPYYSQIFVTATNSKRNEACNSFQIINKSNCRQCLGKDFPISQKQNLTKLKFIYNNSGKKKLNNV